MKLLYQNGLNWEKLKILFKARSVAMHTVDVLVENYFDGATCIKKKLCVVYNNNTKSSTHKAFDHYEASHGYDIDSSHFNS